MSKCKLLQWTGHCKILTGSEKSQEIHNTVVSSVVLRIQLAWSDSLNMKVLKSFSKQEGNFAAKAYFVIVFLGLFLWKFKAVRAKLEKKAFKCIYTLYFFMRKIGFPPRAEYIYFSADIKLKIFLWIVVDYSVWHFPIDLALK